MNALDMNRICRLAPYKVWTDNGIDYYIETNRGQIFVIGFMDDYSIWPTGAYQFTITNRNNQPSPLDQKLRETILLLIEAFLQPTPIYYSISVRRAMDVRHFVVVSSYVGSILTASEMPMLWKQPKCRRIKQETLQPLLSKNQILVSRKSLPSSMRQ